jgi:hypothetical protein
VKLQHHTPKLDKGVKKMATYYVQQKTTVWIQTAVNADSIQEALKIGETYLHEGGGDEVGTSFQWNDSFAVLDENGELIYLNENE